jgi:hypothetical protein
MGNKASGSLGLLDSIVKTGQELKNKNVNEEKSENSEDVLFQSSEEEKSENSFTPTEEVINTIEETSVVSETAAVPIIPLEEQTDKRSYSLKVSTIKKLEELKVFVYKDPKIRYNDIVDEAINLLYSIKKNL